MGRTKRSRQRKRQQNVLPADETQKIEQLLKWMRSHHWKNKSELKCKLFTQTGRGVTSMKDTKSGDVLIEIPRDLMITFKTIVDSGIRDMLKPNTYFKIHDLLALFLAIERNNPASFWLPYINSLPNEIMLPCFCSDDEIKAFPEDLKALCRDSKWHFETSWKRVEEALISPLIDLDSYQWAYAIVNTRSVFVDYENIIDCPQRNWLFDEPNMGLVPLLDMFNHSDELDNKIDFKGESYKLITPCNCKRYDQIFISYGRHDNLKLFVEYGFYLPLNRYDKMYFTPGELTDALSLELDEHQYQLLKNNKVLDSNDLSIQRIDASFKLQTFLYVSLITVTPGFHDIFTEMTNSPDFLDYVMECVIALICFKQSQYLKDLTNYVDAFPNNTFIINFLKSRDAFLTLEHL